jgi:murein DD-endopeptidase MepM/ murein hydrolase activator NlpD
VIPNITIKLLVIAITVAVSLATHSPSHAQELVPHTVAFGETLDALAQSSGESVTHLAQVNGLTRRDRLFPGQKLNLLSPIPSEIRLYRVQANETHVQIAARYGVSPWLLRRLNDLACVACLVPGQLLRVMLPEASKTSSANALPEPLTAIDLSSDQPIQGDVLIVRVATQNAVSVSGIFGKYRMRFAPDEAAGADRFIGMIGVDAMLQPGDYPLVISATTATGEVGAATGTVQIQSGDYVVERVTISPKLAPLLKQKLNDTEAAEVQAVYNQFTIQKWWEDPFEMPVEGRQIAGYGNRRVYNGVNLGSYHSGYDISAPGGRVVRAAAPGRVVFVQKLDIRGLAVIIDHGLGVFTGYFHLSRADVKPGQIVNKDVAIAAVGTTGRSQGNHLHFDLAVGGVTVDPEYWMRAALP